ncbi:hypothetical protein Asfd1_149 [Aeromonas phage Asfd_1]|nr:hypothetical protein Asfd1_149 [Aeromonas phage Asfd_1]
MRIVKDIPLSGPFTVVWTENGQIVSTDLIANGANIMLAKMPELGLGAGSRQELIDNLPVDTIIIVPGGMIFVEVDEMPTEGQFTTYWQYNNEIFSETWSYIDGRLMWVGDDDEWVPIDMEQYKCLDLKFGVWQ